MRQGGEKTGGGLCFCIFVAFLLHLNKLASIIKLNRSRLMFTSADAIQKDNKDNAAISQDAQRRNAGLTESTNNPDGAAAAECSFAMSEYSNTMSATAEQNVLQRRIHLAAHSDSAPQPVSGGSRSMFYYMFKCMVLKYFRKRTCQPQRILVFCIVYAIVANAGFLSFLCPDGRFSEFAAKFGCYWKSYAYSDSYGYYPPGARFWKIRMVAVCTDV